MPGLRGCYKAELGKLPILGRAMRMAGFVPVERANRRPAFEAVDVAVAGFGRATRSCSRPRARAGEAGELQPFKKGGFVMAIKAQVPVVPVALIGTARRCRAGAGSAITAAAHRRRSSTG